MEIYGQQPIINVVLVGFLFGFGFAAGSWLWGVLVGAVNKRRAQP